MKNKLFIRQLLLSVATIVLLCGSVAAQKITIYCTNDLHGHLLKEQSAHIIDATLLGALKHQDPKNTLLLDAGDMAYGTAIADTTLVEHLADLMNLVGYDAMTLGNHEFDSGLSVLGKRIQASKFPYVSANITRESDNQNYLEQFAKTGVPHGASFIKDVSNVKVGIFGITTSHASVPITKGLKFDNDYVKIANAQVDKLRKEGAELIIALTHIGKPEHSDLLLKVDGLDLIIDGHSHQEYVDYNADNTKVLIQTGTEARKVGHIEYDIEKKKVILAELQTFDDVAAVVHNKDVDEKAEQLLKLVQTQYPTLEFELEEPIWGAGVKCLINNKTENMNPLRLNTSLLGKLWGYAMDYAVSKKYPQHQSADTPPEPPTPYPGYVVLKNGGSFRKGLPIGKVSMEDIFMMIPNNSNVYVAKITPKDLYRLLYSGISVMDVKDGLRIPMKDANTGIFLQWMPAVIGEYNPRGQSALFAFADNPNCNYEVDPDDDTSTITLITTEYVMQDTSYGQIEYKDKILLGREQSLLRKFFEECSLSSEDLMQDLMGYERLEVMEFYEEVTPDELYKPSVILRYNDKPAKADVRCTIYPANREPDEKIITLLTSTDASGMLDFPDDVEGPVIISVECDMNIKINGTEVLVTFTGSSYADPAIGCGSEYPLIIDLQR